MNADKHGCRRCGQPVGADAPHGLCPVCLFGVALRPPAPDTETHSAPTLPTPGVRGFGDYELLEEIARGGMGVVHKARQISLNRVVAVKMILGGGLAGPSQVQRFRAEAQAAAELRHPHIVAIHEVGEHAGQLYFSMDYIEGRNLAQMISDFGFRISDFKRSARWMKTVAEAVHYAHQHGILHRDLKPANIIIDPDDQPHITDFGLAKRFVVPPSGGQDRVPPETTATAGAEPAEAGTTDEPSDAVRPAKRLDVEKCASKQTPLTPSLSPTRGSEARQRGWGEGDRERGAIAGRPTCDPGDNCQLSTLNSQLSTSLTLSGQVLGSPSYLSPEQAEGKRGTVGVPSDVYSLGAVLYHLLTGRPPFQGETLTALLRQVIETEPVAPRLLNPSIPRDLETITLKCLEKEPRRRYGRAQELADELGRFLANEPIRARPVHRAERVWRWCRRNPRLAGALGAVVLSLALGLVTTTWQMRRAQRSELTALQRAYAADMDLAGRALAEENIGGVREFLERYAPPTKSPASVPRPLSTLHSPLSTDLRGWEWAYLWQKSRREAAFRLCTRSKRIGGLEFTPDGRRLIVQEHLGDIQVYELETRQPVPGLVQASIGVHMGYSPTNDLVAFPWNIATDPNELEHEVRVWSLRRNTNVARIRYRGEYMKSLAFSPDGRWLAGFGVTGANVWDLTTSNLITHIPSRGGPQVLEAGAVAFSPFGDQLALGDYDGSVRLHALPSGEWEADLPFAESTVIALAFAPNGRWLAASALSSNVWGRVWELPSRRAMELPGLRNPFSGLAFDPSGALLAAGDGQIIRIWDLAECRLLGSLRGHRSIITSLAFASDGRRLASGSFPTTAGASEVLLWDFDRSRRPSASDPRSLTTGKARDNLFPPLWQSIAFAPDSNWFLALTNGCVTRFDAITLTPIAPLPLYGTNNTSFAVAADGLSLVTTGRDGVVHLWDVTTQQERGSFRPYRKPEVVHGMRVLGNGRLVTTVDSGGVPLRIWETATWQQPDRWRSINEGRIDEAIVYAESSRDGRLLATLQFHGRIALWDIASQRLLADVFSAGVSCLALSPDGRWLAFAVSPFTIKLCALPTIEVVGTFAARLPVNGVAFSPDSRRLASTSVGPQIAVNLWDLATCGRLADLTSEAGIYSSPQFSPDGLTLTAMCRGETFFWRVPTLEDIDKEE